MSSCYLVSQELKFYPATTITRKRRTTVTISYQRCTFFYSSHSASDPDPFLHVPHHSSKESLQYHETRIKKKVPGDSIRSRTGIRPSLHPIIINAISQALLLRSNPNLDPTLPMQVITRSETHGQNITPLKVAIAAGKLALRAMEQRNRNHSFLVSQYRDDSNGDQEKENQEEESESSLHPEECQVIAGRVVGVIVRMEPLEKKLIEQVQQVSWVKKYGEYGNFGLLQCECQEERSEEVNESVKNQVKQSLIEDSFLRMCRAECLLALFMHTVESPGLKKAGQSVIDGGFIDFIDQERLDVLIREHP